MFDRWKVNQFIETPMDENPFGVYHSSSGNSNEMGFSHFPPFWKKKKVLWLYHACIFPFHLMNLLNLLKLLIGIEAIRSHIHRTSFDYLIIFIIKSR